MNFIGCRFVIESPNKALQRTAAPLCLQTIREKGLAPVAADRSFQAAVEAWSLGA
jgi:hypothetical protein